MFRGMVELAREFEVAIVGGDTTQSSILTISPTVIGTTTDDKLMTRSGAVIGDMVAVTGKLGASAAGLEMLTNGIHADMKTEDVLKGSHLRPYPRVKEGLILSKYGVKAAIDISDGLIADLSHICCASRVSAVIHSQKIPIEPAVNDCFDDAALSLALTGGEDYELLFTAPEVKIKELMTADLFDITIIGEITGNEPRRVIVLDKDGIPINLPKMGWEHFSK